MAVEHQEFLEELLQILTEDTEEEKSPEEIMSEVVSIVDDYKSEIELEKTELEEQHNLEIMGIEPEEESENSNDEEMVSTPAILNKSINRAFLLSKARTEYNRINNLTDEDIDDFSPSEKVKHRQAVANLYNKMVIEEQSKPVKVIKYSENGPFKKVEGAVRRKVTSEKDLDDSEEIDITPAHSEWKKQQLKEINLSIRNITLEIDNIKKQNKIPKISTSIISRNEETIAELEDELAELKDQKNHYK